APRPTAGHQTLDLGMVVRVHRGQLSRVPKYLRPVDQWPAMPVPQRAFLEAALPTLRRHPALIGLAAGGSFSTAHLDEFSDLDLVLVVDPPAWPLTLDE